MATHHAVRGAINFHAEHVIMRLVNIVPPWLLWVFVLGLGYAFHAFFDGSTWESVGFFLMANAVLTGLTYKLSHTRRTLGKVHNTLTSFLVISWLMFATINGPFENPWFKLWFACGLVLVISWNLRTAIRGDGEEHDSISWSTVDEKTGLNGSRWKTLPGTGANKLLGLVTTPGQAAMSAINSRRDQIAAIMKVPLNNVRPIPVPERADQVMLSIVKNDALRGEVKWAAPEEEGRSIADGPINLGVYEDGEPVKLNLYSPVGARHLLITGMNGAGKSVGARVILADLFSRRDVNVIAIDAVKGTQTLGCAVEGLDWFITNRNRAEEVIHRLISVVNKRADYLGRKGLDVWTPGCGINFLVVLIEEAPAVIRDSDDFTRIVEQARSAGVSVIASIQRASGANMDTNARAQFGASLCFGVRTVMDASFALSDDLVERGANPSLWQQKRPGYAYLQAPDIDENYDIAPLKVNLIEKEQLTAVAEANKSKGLDSITAAAAGELYSDYLKELKGFIEDVESAETGPDEDEQNYVHSQSESTEDEDLIRGFDPADPAAVEAFFEVDDDENVHIGPTEPVDEERLSPAEARSAFSKHLARLQEEKDVIYARDLYPLLEKCGRKRPWLHTELNRRVDNGSLQRDGDGGYRIYRIEE